MTLERILPITLVVLLFTSCSSGRRAEPIELPSTILEQTLSEAGTDPLIEVDDAVPENWWTLFDDEQLKKFILKAFARNPTLQSARAQILLAAYNANSVRAALFPNITWEADVSRQKFSETGIIPFNTTTPTQGKVPLAATGGVNGIPVYFTQYETMFNLTYDFDIWGKNRNTWRAALDQKYAKMADEAFARLQLGIAVAKVYFQLQIDYTREEIAQALVENQTKYLQLTEQRGKNNLADQQSISTSKINRSSAQQSLLQIQRDIAVKEHELKTYLADNFEEEIALVMVDKQPLPKVPLPKDLPLHLIGYRPDIISQLWLIESAGRQIDVAKAGFYPDFNLMALFGYQTLDFRKLFNWPSSTFNVDPAVNLPIFEGGRLIANLRGSEVNYDIAIYQYNNLVLNAVREVLDGIAVLSNSEQQLQEFKNSLKEQESTFHLSNLRVEHNLNSGLDYLVSEQKMLMARDQEVSALGDTLQAVLSLIKALGGGYVACYKN